MSYPTIGFPDYSRLPPAGGRLLGTLIGTIGAQPSTPVISSTGFAYITLMTLGTVPGGNYQVVVNWGYNSDSATRFASVYFVPDADNFNAISFPVLGEWFTVEYFYFSGPTAVPQKTLIYGTTAEPSIPLLGATGSGSINDFINIGANSNATLQGSGACQGRYKLAVSHGINSDWNCNVQQWNPATVAWDYYYSFNGAVYGQSTTQEIALIEAPVQLQVYNTDNVAANLIVSLVPF